jgi:hypothetical protein
MPVLIGMSFKDDGGVCGVGHIVVEIERAFKLL